MNSLQSKQRDTAQSRHAKGRAKDKTHHQPQKRLPQKKEAIVCDHCGKRGHKRAKCFQLKAQEKADDAANESNAQAAYLAANNLPSSPPPLPSFEDDGSNNHTWAHPILSRLDVDTEFVRYPTFSLASDKARHVGARILTKNLCTFIDYLDTNLATLESKVDPIGAYTRFHNLGEIAHRHWSEATAVKWDAYWYSQVALSRALDPIAAYFRNIRCQYVCLFEQLHGLLPDDDKELATWLLCIQEYCGETASKINGMYKEMDGGFSKAFSNWDSRGELEKMLYNGDIDRFEYASVYYQYRMGIEARDRVLNETRPPKKEEKPGDKDSKKKKPDGKDSKQKPPQEENSSSTTKEPDNWQPIFPRGYQTLYDMCPDDPEMLAHYQVKRRTRHCMPLQTFGRDHISKPTEPSGVLRSTVRARRESVESSKTQDTSTTVSSSRKRKYESDSSECTLKRKYAKIADETPPTSPSAEGSPRDPSVTETNDVNEASKFSPTELPSACLAGTSTADSTSAINIEDSPPQSTVALNTEGLPSAVPQLRIKGAAARLQAKSKSLLDYIPTIVSPPTEATTAFIPQSQTTMAAPVDHLAEDSSTAVQSTSNAASASTAASTSNELSASNTPSTLSAPSASKELSDANSADDAPWEPKLVDFWAEGNHQKFYTTHLDHFEIIGGVPPPGAKKVAPHLRHLMTADPLAKVKGSKVTKTPTNKSRSSNVKGGEKAKATNKTKANKATHANTQKKKSSFVPRETWQANIDAFNANHSTNTPNPYQANIDAFNAFQKLPPPKYERWMGYNPTVPEGRFEEMLVEKPIALFGPNAHQYKANIDAFNAEISRSYRNSKKANNNASDAA